MSPKIYQQKHLKIIAEDHVKDNEKNCLIELLHNNKKAIKKS